MTYPEKEGEISSDTLPAHHAKKLSRPRTFNGLGEVYNEEMQISAASSLCHALLHCALCLAVIEEK